MGLACFNICCNILTAALAFHRMLFHSAFFTKAVMRGKYRSFYQFPHTVVMVNGKSGYIAEIYYN